VAFPPEFLEEIRRRLPLSAIVGRRLRLAKKGREFEGLCPFHNEKTPSFFVNDDKAFYHCFGCGAHGDAISFVINTESLSFPEAVEKLAEEAGLELPRQVQIDPAERQRRLSAGSAAEAACLFFEQELRKPGGRGAFDYLKRRGLVEDDLARFRLGFAPDSRGALKSALLKQGYSEEMLLDAGLLIRPEEGGNESYDRFRGRVMFPIADRRGQVIAFGGRVLGDGQPKYLNSPDTALFHKGRVLYALHFAREAARDHPAILVEGYMDVVALHKAGFRTAMAPLGTALTEDQLAETWRLSPEPYLCFDGDAAGQRAASRAALRALPLLEPGRSLRLVLLPEGQDPDELVRGPAGAEGFRTLLANARSLADHLWASETHGRPLDTPERRAALRARLRELVRSIAHPDVREFYGQDFTERQRLLFAPAQPASFKPGRPFRPAAGRGGKGGAGWWLQKDPYIKNGVGTAATLNTSLAPAPINERMAVRGLFAGLINHPVLLEDYHEALASLSLAEGDLDLLRQAIVNISAGYPGLDATALQTHLAECGHAAILSQILHSDVYSLFRSAKPNASLDTVREQCSHLLERLSDRHLAEDEGRAGEEAVSSGTPEAVARVNAFVARRGRGPEDTEADK
jgi:DNA primase